HLVQPGALRRAPAPLAGDDLVGVARAAHRAHHHRLDDAALPDRGGKLVELGLGIVPARIARIGPQLLDRRATLGARALDRALGADIADERSEAAPQSRSAVIWHDHVSRLPRCALTPRPHAAPGCWF